MEYPVHQKTFISIMLKAFFILAFVANLNSVLTDTVATKAAIDESAVIATDDTAEGRIRVRCGPNQFYDICPTCPSRTCKNRDAKPRCLQSLKPNVIYCPRPRCRCLDGYYATDDGKCVLKEDCPPICGLNEVPSDCANNPCLPDCTEPTRDTYCRPNPSICKPGCVCAEGYIRDVNRMCVPKEKCPIMDCKKNEMFTNCTNQVCRAQTCDELGFPLSCYQYDRSSNVCGKPGCICLDGFVKNKEGDCIPATECPSCGGDFNATTGDGSFCTRCSNYLSSFRPCTLVFQLNGCECRKGYVWSEVTKKCVFPEDCPNQCGRNEVPSDCANNPCLPDCTEPRRDTYCKTDLSICKPGCVCAEGYIRDANRECIPREKCPPTSQCGPNQVPSDCANNGCLPDCTEPDRETYCTPNFSLCKSGCVCAEGYIRDTNGECIPREKCPPIECKKNQIFTNCTTEQCRPQTCDELGFPLSCYEFGSKAEECRKPGCVCIKGYVKNKEGDCIPASECPSCGGDFNATTGDGSFCTRCSNYLSSFRPCTLVFQLNGCECRKGYVWSEVTKKCVLPEDCPNQCGRNEVPSDCANNPCLPVCTELPRDYYCRPDLSICKPGCVCAKGYIRDVNGECIPNEKCPTTPQCGRNEVPSDCANNPCLPDCTEPSRDSYCKPNPAICKPGCVCAEGYIRDANRMCIPREKCPTTDCPSNEVKSDCANSPCILDCKTYDMNLACKPNPDSCVSGCVCIDGYFKNGENVCVPKEKCPRKVFVEQSTV